MPHKSPKVSIVMPIFNAEMYVDKAIQSVYEQIFTDFELIMIDDGSTDTSLDILRAWCSRDERFRLIEHEENNGISISRNRGIKESQASFIAFLDADDVWLPDKLQIQFAYHQDTQCAFSCTAFWFGRSLVSFKPHIGYRDLLVNNVVNTSSVMVDVQGISLDFAVTQKSEDYIEWLRVSKAHVIHFISEPLVIRSVFTGESANKFKMALMRWSIYRQVECLGLAASVYYFLAYMVTGIMKYWPSFHATKK